jgi:hypothetical protein
MQGFHTVWREILESAARHDKGWAQKIGFGVSSFAIRQSLLADWQSIEALQLHPAAMAVLQNWFARADRALRRGEGPELLRLLRMIERKVNLELEWQRQDEDAIDF